jgi:hypothetical protein
MKTQVHRIVLLVVDHDHLAPDSVREEVESVRYPNGCIRPQVTDMQWAEVDWSDEHPLNQGGTWRAEFDRLFPKQAGEP